MVLERTASSAREMGRHVRHRLGLLHDPAAQRLPASEHVVLAHLTHVHRLGRLPAEQIGVEPGKRATSAAHRRVEGFEVGERRPRREIAAARGHEVAVAVGGEE